MPWVALSITFVAVTLVILAMVYAFSTAAPLASDRLGRLWRPAPSPVEITPAFAEKQKKRMARALSGAGKLLPSSSKSNKGTQRMLARAGIRAPEAASIISAVRIIGTAGLVATVYFTKLYLSNPALILGGAAILGYLGPDIYLSLKVNRRQKTLRLSLPDALDLLVICVEAGLGLDQSLMRVAQELRIAHPELCLEVDSVTAQVRMGKTRVEALREFADRTGVDDIKALVAMLIQTDRFGTSVAESLRVHSDELRTKRRQRAEEQAAKTTVKMVPPLVMFIFPALFAVILGPAVISVARNLIPIFEK
jgi:tight adherence protein C